MINFSGLWIYGLLRLYPERYGQVSFREVSSSTFVSLNYFVTYHILLEFTWKTETVGLNCAIPSSMYHPHFVHGFQMGMTNFPRFPYYLIGYLLPCDEAQLGEYLSA